MRQITGLFLILTFFIQTFWSGQAWAKEATRIVTLAPSLGELVADLGGANRIVGVSEYTDYPAELKVKKSVGPYSRFNLEEVIALKPDLVLGTLDGNAKDQVEHLKELGLNVVLVAAQSFQDIDTSIGLIGKAMGEEETARALQKRFRDSLTQFSDRAKKRNSVNPPRVLLQLSSDPLVVVGRGSFLQEAVELLGAKNLYSDSKTHYPKPTLEDVLVRNPDIIVVMSLGKDKIEEEKSVNLWKRFSNVTAVKNKRIHVIEADRLVRPTLRIFEGLKKLEGVLYP